ncbi:hypothetical protein EJ063_15135 [Vibrio aquaticus]|uniref:Uncharacterized protein n=1 Tax=Vibrio aquaticus TaxID=2496559 RepID=A0A432CWQ2_9VIBR|nr:hypothetical protein [Vibrio aquaticus]RTZ14648.1 hypothetical protein EJ063_15135 [Vibrio aquaticus]
MKVAVQLFGHLRSYLSTQPYLSSHLLDSYDCDIFIHTWDELEHKDPTWYKSEHLVEDNSVIFDAVKDLYKPKGISIEKNSMIKEEGFFNKDITLRGLKAMLYSQYRVSQLREEYQKSKSIQYDLVITLRPDVLLLAELDLSRYVQEMSYSNKASIHFSNGMHAHTEGSKKIITPLAIDLFFIAKPDTTSLICSSFLGFEKYYIDFSSTYPNGINASEASYLEAMQSNGIMPKFYAFPYVVKRLTGNNHLVAGLEVMEEFDRKLDLPDFIDCNKNDQSKLIAIMLNRLSNEKLDKVKKQLARSKRNMDKLMALCDSIKLKRS